MPFSYFPILCDPPEGENFSWIWYCSINDWENVFLGAYEDDEEIPTALRENVQYLEHLLPFYVYLHVSALKPPAAVSPTIKCFFSARTREKSSERQNLLRKISLIFRLSRPSSFWFTTKMIFLNPTMFSHHRLMTVFDDGAGEGERSIQLITIFYLISNDAHIHFFLPLSINLISINSFSVELFFFSVFAKERKDSFPVNV